VRKPSKFVRTLIEPSVPVIVDAVPGPVVPLSRLSERTSSDFSPGVASLSPRAQPSRDGRLARLDVVFRDELAAIARMRDARLRIVTGHRAELNYDPLSASALTWNIPDLADHDVYVCGPAGMTTAVVAALRAARVPRRQIHHESFEF